MTENTCRLNGPREELILGYLYEELDAGTRAEFERHVERCEACRDELDGLRTVQGRLAAWTPPAFSFKSQVTSPREVEQARRSLRPGTWDLRLPAWAQVAAALLFLGVAAGLANLDVRYDRSGLTIRTGWMASPAVTTAQAPASGAAAPWRPELTALERQLRGAIRDAAVARPVSASAGAASPAPPRDDSEVLRRVRAMVDASERKQEQELALRVAEVMRDVDVQRRADLVRISQSLGQIQNNTGMEVMKQRQLLNYLVSVSQRPQ